MPDYTVVSPDYLTDLSQDAFDNIKSNFLWLRRIMLSNAALIPLAGLRLLYSYDGDGNLTGIVYQKPAGSQIGYATFTYSVGKLTEEKYYYTDLSGYYMKVVHSYTGENLTQSDITQEVI